MRSNPKILPPTRPSTITKVISFEQKTDEIRLQWKPPANDGGSLLKYYRIYVTTESKKCGGEEITVEREDQVPVTYIQGAEKMVQSLNHLCGTSRKCQIPNCRPILNLLFV